MDAVLRRCGTSVTPLPSQGSRSHFQRVPSYTTPCRLRVDPRCGLHRRHRLGAFAIFLALRTSQNKKTAIRGFDSENTSVLAHLYRRASALSHLPYLEPTMISVRLRGRDISLLHRSVQGSAWIDPFIR